MACTCSLLVGATASLGGEAKVDRLVDDRAVEVVGHVRLNPIPGHDGHDDVGRAAAVALAVPQHSQHFLSGPAPTDHPLGHGAALARLALLARIQHLLDAQGGARLVQPARAVLSLSVKEGPLPSTTTTAKASLQAL